MKILITSGGTSEKIDQVRSITNHATGRLGKILAETFLAAGHEVTLLAGKQAVVPEPTDRLTVLRVFDVAHLIELLQPLVMRHDALIHAMAVSDYSPVHMIDFKTVSESSNLSDFLIERKQEGKISSEADYQVLFLKKTPKVIHLVKTWNSRIRLIGFKLLVNVSEKTLLKAARDSLHKNKADYILANDLADISDEGHKAYLVGHQETEIVGTKEAIARLLLDKIEER